MLITRLFQPAKKSRLQPFNGRQCDFNQLGAGLRVNVGADLVNLGVDGLSQGINAHVNVHAGT